jgi:hypothetical protein
MSVVVYPASIEEPADATAAVGELRNRLKVVRTEIRLRHSLAADHELNALDYSHMDPAARKVARKRIRAKHSLAADQEILDFLERQREPARARAEAARAPRQAVNLAAVDEVVASRPPATAEQLVPRIKSALIRGAEAYAEAGKLLAQAKAAMKPGEFEPWLKMHFALSRATAYRYIALAEQPDVSRVRHLHASTDPARKPKEVAAPKAPEPQPVEPAWKSWPHGPERVRAELDDKYAKRATPCSTCGHREQDYYDKLINDVMGGVLSDRSRKDDLVDWDRKKSLALAIIADGYKAQAKKAHPDVGGDAGTMAFLSDVRNMLTRWVEQKG